MFWRLCEAALRQSARRTWRRAAGSPVLALTVVAGSATIIGLGPRMGATFGALQRDAVQMDTRPFSTVLFVMALAAGALTEPAARSMRWRQRQLLASPAHASSLSLSAAAPLAVVTGVVAAVIGPTIHATLGALELPGSSTAALFAGLAAGAAAGAACVGVTRALIHRAWRRVGASVALIGSGWAVAAATAGDAEGTVTIIGRTLVGTPGIIEFVANAVLIAAGLSAWAVTAGIERSVHRARSVRLPLNLAAAVGTAAATGTLRRRDIRSHLLIGASSALGAMALASRLLELDLRLTVLLATPITTVAAFGPALAAGATVRDADWLYGTSPGGRVALRTGTVAAAMWLAAATLTASYALIGLLSGTFTGLLTQIPQSVLTTAVGAAIAARFAPWRSSNPSAPLIGMLTAGAATIGAQVGVSRIESDPGTGQLLPAFAIAAFAFAIAALTPESTR